MEPLSSEFGLAPPGAYDPRAKLAVYLLTCGLILLTFQPWALVGLVVAPLLGIAWLRHWPQWWRMLRALGPTLLLFALVIGLSNGPVEAVGAVLRLLALVSASVLFFAVTPPETLGDALLAGGLSPRWVFLLEGTLRFTPMMARLAQEVRAAQESRGIRLDGRYLLLNGYALLGPLLASVMRFADDLAEALEVRGFGGPVRTPLADYRFRWRDWALILATGVLAAGWLVLVD